MRPLLGLSSLFLTVILIQLAMGGVGPLDALSGLALGFSTAQIGLLGSAHFLGFFIGCWWTPRLMGQVGHARAFAALGAVGVIGLLAHMLMPNALAWAGLRVATGMSVAGCYTVIEAWLQSRLDNSNRGRAFGVYRVVDLSAQLGAQLIISVLTPASYAAYTALAIIAAAALLPLTMSTAYAPSLPDRLRLQPLLALRRSPLAVTAVLVAAVGGASFRMVGPVLLGTQSFSPKQIGVYLAIFVAGGAFAQWPAGWLADRIDRRRVLIFLSLASVASSGVSVILAGEDYSALLASAFLFGATTFPIYSVACSHAHDFATDEERAELTAALIFWFAVGAIAAPLTGSWLLEAFGAAGLFGMIGAAHLLLVIYGLARMRVRPSPATRTAYAYAPRTSFIVGTMSAWLRRRKL